MNVKAGPGSGRGPGALRAGSAAAPQPDGRAAAATAHQHRPPDPFEDIAAPRLRLLRQGTPVLAKPRTAPLHPVPLASSPQEAPPAPRRKSAGEAAEVTRPDRRKDSANRVEPRANVLRLSRGSEADATGEPVEGASRGQVLQDRASGWLAASATNAGGSSSDVVSGAHAPAPPGSASAPKARDAAADVEIKDAVPSAGQAVAGAPDRRGSGAGAGAAPSERCDDGAGDAARPEQAATAAPVDEVGQTRTGPMGRAAPAARVVSAAGGRAAADLRRGVGIGVLLAAALIAVALFLRTSAVETAPPDAAATDIAPGPIPEIAREAPAATPVQAVAVRLRLGPGQAEAQDNALRAAAQAAGHSVAVRRMPFPIARSRIEYYDAADRAAAQALARALAPVLKGPVEIRDLGGAADTTQGLDVWIAG